VDTPTDTSVTSDQAQISISSPGRPKRTGRTFPISDQDARRSQPHPVLRVTFSLTEGDLIIGKQNQTAIGTLVERQTGYLMLLHLPDGYEPEQVRDVLTAKIKTLPESLRLSLTWDQGPEMRDWKHVSIAAGIDIYFCDPHSAWQRGSNENTVSVGPGPVGLMNQAGAGSSR
jgi:IS30 family transposase